VCVAVWKRRQADWAMGGSYRLVLTAGVTPAAGDAAPVVTRVDGARPNPFNPRVTVDFTVGSAGRVEFAVFDVLGRRVRRLVAADLGAGSHQVVWDGLDDVGRSVASGTYLLRLDGPDGVSARRRVTMLK